MYHFKAKSIGRSKGQSAVGSAAYRAGKKYIEQIVDKETGVVAEVIHNYKGKGGVVHNEMMIPEYLDAEKVPEWIKDAEQFWNKVQNQYDRRKDSEFAKEYIFGLPKELSLEQNTELAREFVRDAFLARGWVCQLNIKYKNDNNPLAYVMLSSRAVKIDVAGEVTLGNKSTDFEYMGRTHSNISSKSFLLCAREAYAVFQNKHLELAGVNKVVTHKSYRELGIKVKATLNEGAGRHMNKRGLESDRCIENASIVMKNMQVFRKEPEQILKLLSIEKRYFTEADIEKKIGEIVDNYIEACLKLLEAGECEEEDFKDADVLNREIFESVLSLKALEDFNFKGGPKS